MIAVESRQCFVGLCSGREAYLHESLDVNLVLVAVLQYSYAGRVSWAIAVVHQRQFGSSCAYIFGLQHCTVHYSS